MRPPSFQILYTYNHTSNQKFLTIFRSQEMAISEKSLKWMSHILNAQEIWNARIRGEKPLYDVWQVHAIKDLATIDQANLESSRRILENQNLAETVRIQNSKGEPATYRISDILFQILNHATYHRGQIASDFALCGIKPVSTDFHQFSRLLTEND